MKFIFNHLSCKAGHLIEGPILIKPKVFEDERGFFYESWNKEDWLEILNTFNQPYKTFVQDNHSKSKKGVLRGLHFQKDPKPQGKLIRCVVGQIFDVAVDIRKGSKTYGDWVSVLLTSKNQNQLWIPEGFAHGFLTISDFAEVNYKTTDFWDKDCEETILWKDESIDIDWPIKEFNIESLLVSIKDKDGRTFKEFD